MPHPVAHPAVAIPFARAGMVLSALVIGSIAPDFGYFLPLPGFFMYTLPGLFLFNLPMGLLLLWLFHTFAKWPLISLLPASLQSRLIPYAQGFSFGPPRRFLMILLSLLAGSVTHVVWDSFTHSYGRIVERFPGFFHTSIAGIPLYDIFQDGGTILGLGFIVYWLARWLPTAPQGDQLSPRFSGRVQMLFLALTFFSLALVEGRILYLRMITGSRFIGGHFLLNSIRFSAVLTISFFIGIYCLAWMIKFYGTVRPTRVSG
ncbi:MAG TPA: DUF4184 family protein [Anaerolineales bacterium]|nr:DUF4184 family protein [Anaerolineales bacterium]